MEDVPALENDAQAAADHTEARALSAMARAREFWAEIGEGVQRAEARRRLELVLRYRLGAPAQPCD